MTPEAKKRKQQKKKLRQKQKKAAERVAPLGDHQQDLSPEPENNDLINDSSSNEETGLDESALNINDNSPSNELSVTDNTAATTVGEEMLKQIPVETQDPTYEPVISTDHSTNKGYAANAMGFESLENPDLQYEDDRAVDENANQPTSETKMEATHDTRQFSKNEPAQTPSYNDDMDINILQPPSELDTKTPEEIIDTDTQKELSNVESVDFEQKLDQSIGEQQQPLIQDKILTVSPTVSPIEASTTGNHLEQPEEITTLGKASDFDLFPSQEPTEPLPWESQHSEQAQQAVVNPTSHESIIQQEHLTGAQPPPTDHQQQQGSLNGPLPGFSPDVPKWTHSEVPDAQLNPVRDNLEPGTASNDAKKDSNNGAEQFATSEQLSFVEQIQADDHPSDENDVSNSLDKEGMFWENSDNSTEKLQEDTIDEPSEPTIILNNEREMGHMQEETELQEKPKVIPKKFSFLEEDDDLLDDDADSFLGSDEELLPNKDSIANVTEKPVQNNYEMGNAITPQKSKYQPTLSQPSLQTHRIPSPQNQNAFITAGSSSVSINAGLIPPQSFNNFITNDRSLSQQSQAQAVLPTSNFPRSVEQTKILKLKEEKKKSDAYDFPLEIISDDTKRGHAKPVNVPSRFGPNTFKTAPSITPHSRVSSMSGPSKPGFDPSKGIPLAQPLRSSIASPPVKNPYAVPDVIPTQGMVMPVGITSPTIPFQQPGPNVFTSIPSRQYLGNNVSQTASTSIASDIHGRQHSNNYMPQLQSTPGLHGSKPPTRNKYAPPSTHVAPSATTPIGNAVQPGLQINIPTQMGAAVRATSYDNTQQVISPMLAMAPALPMNSNNGSLPGSTFVPQGQRLSVVGSTPTAANAIPLLTPGQPSVVPKGRTHARSNSSVYAPAQNMQASRYAPTVHPQFQQDIPINQHAQFPPTSFPLQTQTSQLSQAPPSSFPPQSQISQLPQVPTATYPSQTQHYQQVPQSMNRERDAEVVDHQPIDNQALLSRQFPIFHWTNSNKVLYGIPKNTGSNYGSGNSLECINIVNYESSIQPNLVLKSFVGPLINGKTRVKDLEAWLDNVIDDLSSKDPSKDLTVWRLLRLQLSAKTTLKDISSVLYDSTQLLAYLSQPLPNIELTPNAFKIDQASQMKVLSCLQTGNHNAALQLSLEKKDYAMALLLGSLAGKNKWSEVVQQYLSQEFTATAPEQNEWANLLSLIFQAFIGNSKMAMDKFYRNSADGHWAINNWKQIVAAVLMNVNAENDSTPSNTAKMPLVVTEFLLEFGIFLKQKSQDLAASIVFMIARIPLSLSPVMPDTMFTFDTIGKSSTIESCLWSEVYEFSFSSAPKFAGFPCILPQKMFHAYCLQEQGFISNASKYCDYLTNILKTQPKTDITVMNLTLSLTDLTTRVSDSNTGWLTKPKLGSVWGQLDKSFNRFIGGDDIEMDAKVKKKVFDGFTPSSSNNSSVVDLSLKGAAPQLQSHITMRSDSTKENHAFLPNPHVSAHISSSNHPNPNTVHNNRQVYGFQNQSDLSLLPPKVGNSLQGSPQRLPVLQPSEQPAETSMHDLRRVQTEELTLESLSSNVGVGHPVIKTKSTEPMQSSNKKIDLPDRSSMTPLATDHQTVLPSDNETPIVPRKPAFVAPLNAPVLPVERTDFVIATTSDANVVEGSEPELIPKRESAVSSSENVNDKHSEELPSTTMMDQFIPKEVETHEEPTPDASLITESEANVKPPSTEAVSEQCNTTVEDNQEQFNKPTITPINTDAQRNVATKPIVPPPSFVAAESPKRLASNNGYAAVKPIQNRYAPSPSLSPSQGHSGDVNKYTPSAPYTNPIQNVEMNEHLSNPDVIPAVPFVSRPSMFAPVQKPEVITDSTFEPVVKIPPPNTSFNPIATKVDETQYNDIVEDESDDEDDTEHAPKSEQDDIKQEKEKEKAKNKNRSSEGGTWLRWLKKDSDGKKPIKATLGTTNQLRYDEQLGRWISKNATEEEKAKIAADANALPPPPPIVKRKDTVPKTSPRPSFSAGHTVGSIMPTNSLTGEQLLSPTLSQGSSMTPSLPPSRNHTLPPPHTNLSGKKANDLDDLMSLSRVRRTTGRKPGKGYVNVLESLNSTQKK
ncbi:COPII coat assembly protein SEC16 NDAI_0E02720 [Naumovozyma dairenensis CBS 421]|uniref:COPII coat assembly protein SEC16 n=1 Tax=Naumovozyma dairenensis (strain ATCC 10597 / BCRC 20456 / CBS 421 / NBRC 0211 / NRRL Y-12639) TaxID=1071378 RepID=G0WBG9_NAUDC|nr:hypothetical protein NDAI_0E02720 [Naumovozyma dairenensis CBS 421]CCD25089.1 hypothetical protein NDAI_0E02720 [Naumovozyma dairenensis CBS 421]